MIYPLGAPLMLSIAGSAILTGSLYPEFASFCFAWVVPSAFFMLTMVMMSASRWKVDLPSFVLLSGATLSLHQSFCGVIEDENVGIVCFKVSPLLPASLAVAGPAILIARFGPDDPILLCWLGSTLVGLVPALPSEYQALLWKPGVISPLLLFTQAALMLRTRRQLRQPGVVSPSKKDL